MPARNPAVWISELAKTASRFKVVLETELRLLSQWPVDNLSDLAQEKAQLTFQLERLESERHLWLRERGASQPTRSTMASTLALEAHGQSLFDQWCAAMDIVKACQPLNQQVGLSIHLMAQKTRRSIEILTGTRQHNTYGKSGSAAEKLSRGIISTA